MDPVVETLRTRAKAQFPSVLLTLTSIIQAIAFESLSSRISELAEPAGFLAISLEAGLQIGAMILAIVLLWVYYAQLVMRLIWIPRLTDSLIPFALGLGQFLAIDTLGQGRIGLWLAPFPVIFLLSFSGWNWTIARAREEVENAEVIAAYLHESPWVRHGPMVASIVLLVLLSVSAWVWPRTSIAALAMLDLLLAMHIWMQGWYWRVTVLGVRHEARA